MEYLLSISLICIFLCQLVKCDNPIVQEIDSKDFIGKCANVGFTAAFGDVNSDKQTDVFVISVSGEEVYIFLGSSKPPWLKLQQTLSLDIKGKSLVSADFNGDDMADIMITYANDKNSNSIIIFWGQNGGNFGTNSSYKSSEIFYDEPLVLDANADMIADLFVVYPNQTRAFLVGQNVQDNWEFVEKPFKTKDSSIKIFDAYFPHSNAFIDLTGDGSADLFITSTKDGKIVYEVWEGSSSGLILAKTISTADDKNFTDSTIIGPTTFIDFDADGKQDLIVSTCSDKSCDEGKILLYSKDEWHAIYSTTNGKWKFPSEEGTFSHEYNTLHIGDFNLDSYPDVLTIMENENGVRKAVVLYNNICNNCGEVGRQLGQLLEMPDSDNAFLAAYYDFSMDGTLDVIVTTKPVEKYTMMAYKNMIADDVTFLRVQVLPGHDESAVYGVNVPGPQMVYQTTNTMGGAQCGSLGQLSQSAHHSLQLPYVIFGLGRLANFVDSLTVSVPVPLIIDEAPAVTEEKEKRSNSTASVNPFSPLNHTWPMLIPNSQLYVIPYPHDTSSSWKNRLLVTPSQNVIKTAMVLLGTCGLLIIATFVLHWLEKREDRKEKIQEAHRFHFDAM